MGFFEAMASAIVVGQMITGPEVVTTDYMMPDQTIMTVDALISEVDNVRELLLVLDQ
jgi:hypothetical protein